MGRETRPAQRATRDRYVSPAPDFGKTLEAHAPSSRHHHTHTDSHPSPSPPTTNPRVNIPPSMDSQSDPNGPYRLRRLDTAQDPPASQTTQTSGGAASRLSVRTGSQCGLRIEPPPPHRAWGKRLPTIAENEEDFELDEVDAEVSKKIGS